ncbi:MAG: DNA repair protein RecN [Halothiobacillaceae bacterium]
MLSQLHIRDFALIERLRLDFGAGMTTLTGETGAGKSILIDALGLVLGARANAALVRPQADAAEVTAVFSIEDDSPAQRWLVEQALEEDEECILRRVVKADGKSRAWINGRPVPLQSMRALSEQLISIHGQHENQRLMQASVQRDILDGFGGLDTPRTKIRTMARELAEMTARQAQLEADQAARADRLELLGYQLEEIDEIAPEDDEFDTLHEQLQRLSHADELAATDDRLTAELYEADDSLHDRISRAARTLDGLMVHDPALAPIVESLETANVHLEEAAAALRQHRETLEHDPETLARVQSRLDILHDLARRHRVAPEQLTPHVASLRTEHERLQGESEDASGLADRIAQARSEYRAQAEALSHKRREAAERLGVAVTEAIRQLGMPHGSFTVMVTHDPEQIAEHGSDEIRFEIAPNPGQPAKPLAKIASGGELSRVSLALKALTATHDPVPTFIFDEVDTGIGGATADIVGRYLRRLGQTRQVFCVTHLAQVAAHGHHQCRITKHQDPEQTRTEVESLQADQRVDELARMLGGATLTERTRQLAREMLDAAKTETMD